MLFSQWTYRDVLKRASLSLLGMVAFHGLLGQDLENIKETKWFDYSGGISMNTTFYQARGMENRRDPFFWQLNANLNLSFFDGIVQAPFSMTVSQQNKRFSQPQPFNRFGLSPTYKGFTAHLGHRSLNFSQYTLAGNLFLGAGVEYRPETNPIRVSMVYGRFAKPVSQFTQEGAVFANPTFRRMGYGAKVGWEKDGQEVHLILFRASDDKESIPITDSLDVTPEENLVVGFVSNFKLFERLTWTADFAHSMHTRNTLSQEVFIDEFTFRNNLGGLFTPRVSSTYTNALTTALTYSGDGFQVNATYRRVDPEFRTLGSSFLNNDLEDISGGVTFPLFRNRLSLNSSAGLQRNNLNNQLTSNIARFIWSAGANVNVSERTNVNLNYSNFNSSTRQTLIQSDILSDTLEFFQVSRNGTANLSHSWGTASAPMSLNVLGTFQRAEDSENNNSTFLTGSLSYQVRLLKIWNLSVSATANNNKMADLETLTAGPVLSVSRTFIDGKIRTSFSGSALNVYTAGSLQSHITNLRVNAGFRLAKKHSFTLGTFYIIKRTPMEGLTEDIREWRGNVNYSFRI